MFDHLLGIILLGLGIQSPVTQPAVKGDSTESAQEGSRVERFKKDNGVFQWLGPKSEDEQMASRPGSTREDMQEKVRTALRDKQQKFRDKLATQVATAETVQTAKLAKFEEKLRTFTDAVKKEKVESLQARVTKHNERVTDGATEVIAKMTDVLDRVMAKIAEEKQNGKDTTEADAAATAAQAAITAAQDAIAAQAAKTYVIPITTETNAQSETSNTATELKDDTKAMHDKVVAARKAVSSVVRALAALRGEKIPDQIIK